MKMANLGAIAITALIFAVLVAEGNADHEVGISRFLAAQSKAVKCSDNNGICESQNNNNLMCCNQSCVNALTDLYNCGACGNACSFGYACCNGKCVNTAYDPSNCGRCGVTCSNCILGMCSYA